MVLWALVVLVSALWGVGCSRGGGSPEGLLAGQRPIEAKGVSDVERITDGAVPRVGSGWRSNRTAVFDSKDAYIDYDLGSEQPIGAIALLADNNDFYEVLGSLDGKTYQRLWVGQRVSGSGLRWRSGKNLQGKTRYLRLKPQRGDSSLSVAEFVVFSEPNPALPPQLKEVSAVPSGLAFRSALLVFATAIFAAVLFMYRGGPLLWTLALGLLPIAAAIPMVRAFDDASPVESLEVAFTRGVVAAIALWVVAREGFGPRRYPANPVIGVATLSLTAVIAVAAFYNLGRPQFYDHVNKEPSVVHNFDMRVYYPVAKYFDELKYDGLYLASVATYAEEHGGLERPSMQKVELRDLRDHRMRKVSDIQGEVVRIKERFSPERWEALKKDMRYFWETMGSGGYLGSMRDHGGNATPVWFAITHLMFKNTEASNSVLLWAGLLDPLLLLLFFVVAWRTFGARTALVTMVIFGANDFYMFGSNWAGATLRHDWMVYLGLGVCALKTRRFVLGGALLAMSALIRAFPAITLLALVVPLGWWVYDRYQRDGKLPHPREILEGNQWLLRTALGAVGCVAVMVLFSSLVLGFDSWPLWVKKISSFTSDPHVNHVSLLTVTSGSEGNQALVRSSRLPFHIGATAVYLALGVWAARRSAPHQVALIGMMMMPVLMYPANYYIHFIFLLPMLVDEKPAGSSPRIGPFTAKVWMALLGLCVAQYFTVKEKELDVHFYNASVLLMITTLVVLVFLIQRGLASQGGWALAGGEVLGVTSPDAGENTAAVRSEPKPELAPEESSRMADERAEGEQEAAESTPVPGGEPKS